MFRNFLCYLSLLTITLTPLTSAKELWWKLYGDIKKQQYGGGRIKEDTPENIAKAAKQRNFKEWVTYEDEVIKFRYPKHPLIKLEVKKPKDGIKVEGGVVTTVDNSYQSAYVLTVGDLNYHTILVNSADWLDDGIYLCGPMVHHAYQIRKGCLVRYSFLPGGAIKKAQILGDNMRLMAFEWTHLACSRQAYERIVDSMELKVPHKSSAKELKAKVCELYELEGKVGWVNIGSSTEEAIKLLGEPISKKDSIWTWKNTGKNYHWLFKATVANGTIVKHHSEGFEADETNPIKGSAAWINRIAKGLKAGVEEDPFGNNDPFEDDDPFGDNENIKPIKLTEKEKQELFDITLKYLARDDHDPYEYGEVLGSLEKLHKHYGFKLEPFKKNILANAPVYYTSTDFIHTHYKADYRQWYSTKFEALIKEEWMPKKIKDPENLIQLTSSYLNAAEKDYTLADDGEILSFPPDWPSKLLNISKGNDEKLNALLYLGWNKNKNFNQKLVETCLTSKDEHTRYSAIWYCWDRYSEKLHPLTDRKKLAKLIQALPKGKEHDKPWFKTILAELTKE